MEWEPRPGQKLVTIIMLFAAMHPWWPLWVMGCRCDYVGITTAVPQIAADLLPLPKSAGSGQSHRFGRTVIAAAYVQRTDLSDQGSAIPSRAITGGADHECVWPTP